MSFLELDRASLLVHVAAHTPMSELASALAREGLGLGGERVTFDGTVGAWLEHGAPGARSAWLDPADHLVAGFTAVIASTNESFSIRPAPRRAVGPDLLALVLGLRGRLLGLESVWLRVHREDAARPTTDPFRDDDEPLGRDEESLLDAIARELR